MFDDEGLMSMIVGPSIPAPPVEQTPEERATEVNTLKKTLRLSLQSPEAPETSFSIRPRQCVHSREFDECRTCSLRENTNKTAAELFFADLEWHPTWKQEQLLWNATIEVRKTVVDIANLSKAMYEIVDLDVHEVLTNLQFLIESRATQHNFLSVMNSVKVVMKIPLRTSRRRRQSPI